MTVVGTTVGRQFVRRMSSFLKDHFSWIIPRIVAYLPAGRIVDISQHGGLSRGVFYDVWVVFDA